MCHGFGAAAGAELVPMAIGNDATPSGLMLLLLLVLVMLMMVVAVLVMVLVMLVMALLVYWML